MQRTAIEKLKKWKDKKGHKPLIIEGARQVGKTWLMKEFGKKYYEQVVYLHFDNNPELAAVFENDYKIPRLIESFEILEIFPVILEKFDDGYFGKERVNSSSSCSSAISCAFTLI